MPKRFTYTFSTPAGSDIQVTTGNDPQSITTAGGVTYQGFAITNISGTFNGQGIVNYNGTSGAYQMDANGDSQDNAIFINGSQGQGGSLDGIDGAGISFRIANGTIYNLYFNGAGGFTYNQNTATGPSGNPPSNATLQQTNYSAQVCFTTGTLIRVARGGAEADVAVEHLRIGDLVVTSTGRRRPIRWIGHRTLDCTRHPNPQAAWPVRIAAHAFGEGRPARDLLLSLGHAVCLDMLGEVLVPSFKLLNGATVRQEEVDSVTYWHVELESHDVILAEGMGCESYIELGNRGFFRENAIVALDGVPDALQTLSGMIGTAGTAGAPGTLADYCRPLHLDGPIVDAARLQLRRRTEAAGWRLEVADPLAGLHLLADGVRIAPRVRGLTVCFTVPEGVADMWLVADTVRPCDCGAGTDGRALGVRVAGLAAIDGFGAERRIALGDTTLGEGWHAVENEAGCLARWTAGRAQLPADLISAAVVLRVELAGSALPRWVAPEDTKITEHRTQQVA